MRSILVHLDASPACAVRLQLARKLAKLHQARVTALFAVTPGVSSLPSSFSASGFADLAPTLDIDGRDHARAALEKWVSLGGPAVEWAETVAESPLKALARCALFADLLVLGKRAPTGPYANQLPRGFAESVVIESGRPALVVPDGERAGEIGRTVLVAWKPTRESARAVTAALPILRCASAVHVVIWQEESKPGRASPAPAPEGIRTFLLRQAVSAQVHALGNAPADMGAAILAQATRLGADLLVMGCYGRSRIRELVLGGASRSVLRSMPLPVLMAH